MKFTDDEDSVPVLTHQPCEDCGSSDALTVYSDGHTYCFSCHARGSSDDEYEIPKQVEKKDNGLLKGKAEALPARNITEETCRKWSYHIVDWHGRKTHAANYKTQDGVTVAQKLRTKDKEFPWKGVRKEFKGLYGQWLWPRGGRMVVVVEGELDALSVSQAQQNKWPVVALVDGAGSAKKGIKEALDYLGSFDKVVLLFDNDEPGREATDVAKKLLPAGKAYIGKWPDDIKDANDALKQGRSKLITDTIWQAQQYVPAGLVSGKKLVDRYFNRPVVNSLPYPDYMEMLNQKALGIRFAELDTWTSGTGMGKTTLIKALQHHLYHTTPYNQAIIHLEEPLEDTIQDFVSYELGVPLKFKEVDPDVERKAAHDLFLSRDTNGSPRFQLYDAFGSMDDDDLFNLIRYAVKGADCPIVWLDHLSILVSDTDADTDERRRIDRIMHELKSLTQELHCYIGLISHLKKAQQGKSFENGYVPTLDDLRGSGSIKQLSNSVFAISRDQQADSSEARNTSGLHVLKCRYTGRTGPAGWVRYNPDTGRLEEGSDPALIDEFEGADEY